MQIFESLEWQDIGSAGLVFFFSTFFYKVGALLAMAKFKPIVGFFLTIAGGLVGVFVFVYLSFWMEKITKKRKGKRITKTKRLLVRLNQRGGLLLVALVTPFLSIPVGSFAATRFERNRKRVLLFLSMSVLLWSSVIFGSLGLFGVNIPRMLGLE